MKKTWLHLLATAGFLALATASRAELIYAVNGNNELLTFDSAAPSVVVSRTAITSTGTDAILNIDFRPATGELFGLSGNNDLYRIDPVTGVAAFVGATGITGGFDYGFDFNPVPDRIRVVTDTGSNFRVNPANGALTTDTALFYISGDANNGTPPQVAGAAYTNSVPGVVSSTQLFYIDFNLDILAFSPNPNLGELQTRGALGLDVTGLMGFDISGLSGLAYASLSTDGTTSGLYTIDLATGVATPLGSVGAGESILDISAAPIPEPSTYLLLGLGVLGLFVARRRALKNA